jgi:hypothetical protein
MKKWLIALIIICLLLIACVYIFIPATLKISKISRINCSQNAADRFLLDESNWQKWWPGTKSRNLSTLPLNQAFLFNGYSYKIHQFFSDKIKILKTSGDDSINTVISISPINSNSIILQWYCELPASYNPFKRIFLFKKAVKIKRDMTDIFLQLQTFLEKPVNIYGFPIEEIISKDSTLIATRYLTNVYPVTAGIYDLIDTMRKYIVSQGAKETDPPMLRVTKSKDGMYQTMIAIPTNKILTSNGIFFFQRFVPYKTLIGTVRGGGVNTIEEAFRQMEIFIADHQRSSMSVPFQSLVTERNIEPDSLKWVTLVCQPVS